jgi:prolyl oligopeptidase
MNGSRHLAAAAAAAFLGAVALAGEKVDRNSQAAEQHDPYLWLEDIHGAKALEWVKAQNAKSTAVLQADPDYQKDYDAILRVLDATDRIPYGELDHQFVFNFWQDAQHPKGIWRRTTIAGYANAAPAWELLLDLDKLAADEHENWVWKGADCAPSLKRCLLTLSRGGGDAAVVREFDLGTRAFVRDGFALAEAKSSISWLDEDTVVFGTDFGPGSMTSSGYPRVAKIWKRGGPQALARTVYEGKESDVASAGVVFHDPAGTLALIQRDVSFFTAEYYSLTGDGATQRLPLPLGADLKGAQADNLIFTLREDWTPPGGVAIRKGSMIGYSMPAAGKPAGAGAISVLYVPDAHSAIDEVATGRDAVYASINHDVTGSVHVFRRGANNTWSDTTLALPAAGSAHVVTANAWGPEAQFSYESYTTPATLYTEAGVV